MRTKGRPTTTAETATLNGFVVLEIWHGSRVPQEIIDEILDHLVADCALHRNQSLPKSIRSWITPCGRHIFHTIVFSVVGMHQWLKGFPVPVSRAYPVVYQREENDPVGKRRSLFQYPLLRRIATVCDLLDHPGGND